MIAACRHPRICIASFLSLLVGVAYQFSPVSLIPNRISYIGYSDELGFIVGGAWLARRLLPKSLLANGVSPVPSASLRSSVRSAALHIAAVFGSPLLLRLCLGRWGTKEERRQFGSGLTRGPKVVAPILRGLNAVSAAKEQVGRLAVLNLMREGQLPPPPRLGAHRVASYAPIGNPLSFRTERPIAFLHLEKTGGIALAGAVIEWMHPLQVNNDPQRSMPPHVRCPFIGTAAQNARGAKLIWGHYDLPSIRRVDPDRTVFTVLREPRTRLISLYTYWRSVDPSLLSEFGDNFNVRAAHDHDLLGFLRIPDPLIRDYVDNFYVRRFTGLYATGAERDPIVVDPDCALKCALAALSSIDFVGITEALDACLAPLGAAIDVRLPARLPRVNETSRNLGESARLFRRIERPRLTPEIEAELVQATRLDRVLYETAYHGLKSRLGEQRPDPRIAVTPELPGRGDDVGG